MVQQLKLSNFFSKISHIVLFIVEGLSSYHFIANESMFSHIKNNLKYRLEVMTPAIYGGSIVEELAAIPLTKIHNDNLIKRMYIYPYLNKYCNMFFIKINLSYCI